MSRPVHFMLDIETLGTTPGSVVLCLAVRSFDPDEVGTFYACETITLPHIEQLQRRFRIDPGTLAWWCDESRQPLFRKLFAASLGCRETLAGQLGHLSRLMAEPLAHGAVVWANSPSFDLVLLESLYRAIGEQPPWKYWQTRDLRTAIAEHGFSRSSEVLSAPAEEHHPDVDCEYQVRVLWAARQGRGKA